MQGTDVRQVCEARAYSIGASAAHQSGIDYMVDSVKGLNRTHTRVSTSGTSDFFRERHYQALRTACGMAGGNVVGIKGYRALAKAHESAMRKHNKSVWKRSYS